MRCWICFSPWYWQWFAGQRCTPACVSTQRKFTSIINIYINSDDTGLWNLEGISFSFQSERHPHGFVQSGHVPLMQRKIYHRKCQKCTQELSSSSKYLFSWLPVLMTVVQKMQNTNKNKTCCTQHRVWINFFNWLCGLHSKAGEIPQFLILFQCIIITLMFLYPYNLLCPSNLHTQQFCLCCASFALCHSDICVPVHHLRSKSAPTWDQEEEKGPVHWVVASSVQNMCGSADQLGILANQEILLRVSVYISPMSTSHWLVYHVLEHTRNTCLACWSAG